MALTMVERTGQRIIRAVTVNAEQSPSRIRPVIDRLAKISLSKVGPLLDAELASKQTVDPKAGIVIVHLDDAPVVSDAGHEYDFYAARVLTSNPDNPNFVNPHYHLIGEEPYIILSGDNGEMNLGRVVDGKVVWDEPRKIVVGDSVEVQEGEVHSLRNNGKEPMDFVFACPHNHLQDHGDENPEGDRYFTMHLENGIPPWYPEK